MINALAALTIAMIVLAVGRHSMRHGRVEFTAFGFFSAGFLYYWILPLLFAANVEHLEFEGLSLAGDILGRMGGGGGVSFFAWMCFGCYGAFWLGYSRFVRDAEPSPAYPPFHEPYRGLREVIVFTAGAAAVMAFRVRDHLFRGYYEELFEGYEGGVLADVLPRGAFVASVSMLFVVCLMWTSQVTARSTSIRAFLTSKAMLLYYAFQVLVVSMGGRLYLASNVLSLLAFMTLRYRVSVRPARLAALGAGIVVLAGIAGVIRAGGGISLAPALMNVAQEPGLTSVSLFAFLDAGEFPVLLFPRFLLSDFSNLLPSILFPDKASLLLKPQDFGYVISMPFGGLHLLVSLIVNFGWIGAIAVFFVMGAGLARLRDATSSWLGQIVYSLIAGWLGFTLFRDPMSVSIVKNIFQVSVVWPLALVLVLRTAYRLSERRAVALARSTNRA